MAKGKLRWKKKPDRVDYDAAQSYLSLVFTEAHAHELVRALRRSSASERSAKDLLRASGLPLLPEDESSVAEDLKRIGKSKPLSPVLLVRGDMTRGMPLILADGYHRICAVYYFDEHAPVACQMTGR